MDGYRRFETQVPEGWELVRLGDVLVMDQPGAWGDEPTPDNPGVMVLRAANLTRDGRIDLTKVAHRRLTDLDLKQRLMRDGDVLLERSGGGPGTPVGRVALVNGLGDVYCNNFCQHLRLDTSLCYPQYAVRILWHWYCQGVTARLEQQTTGIRNLDYPGYLAHSMLLPPLQEQRAIAAILDSIDEAIERTEEVIAAMVQLRGSLLHELLTRGVPGWHTEWKDVPGLGTVPADWEVVRLGDVAEVNPQRPHLNVEPHALVTFLPMAAIAEDCGGILVRDAREFQRVSSGYTYFEEDDVLFSKITPCLQNGKHALVAGLPRGFGFGTTELHVIRAGSRIDQRHLFSVLTQPAAITTCTKSFTGTAGQQRIQSETLSALRILLPPLPEQRSIAATIDGLDGAVARARRERERMQSLKESAAEALLTGRVQVSL